MSKVAKPVVLNETGRTSNQKIEDLGLKIDEDRISMAEQLANLGIRIEALTASIPSIIEAMDRLDIIYYAEQA